MPFNVLLLPLLGGYIFINSSNLTRFDAKRYSGERLIFQSAMGGVVFLLLAYVATRFVLAWKPVAGVWWQSHVPFEHSATSLLALGLACLAAAGTNAFWKRDARIQKTIEAWNDYLEVMLYGALKAMRQVAITMKNGKVYVGFIIGTFDPAYDRKYILLLPTVSGFRRTQTHELVFTTDYTRVYQDLLAEDETRIVRGVPDFQIVLPVAEVISASLFDWNTFRRFGTSSAENALSQPHIVSTPQPAGTTQR